MDVIEALRKRRSTRAYKPKPVDRGIILEILDAANCAPSWANTQPWEFYVAGGEALDNIRARYVQNLGRDIPRNPDLPAPQSWPEAHKNRTLAWGAKRLKTQWGIDPNNPEHQEALVAQQKELALNNNRFFDAPVVVFACMDKGLSQWSLCDMGVVSQSMMLAAQHHGLNTIIAFHFAGYPEILRQELQIPDNLNILFGIAIGYGDPESIQNKHIASRRPIEEFVKLVGF